MACTAERATCERPGCCRSHRILCQRLCRVNRLDGLVLTNLGEAFFGPLGHRLAGHGPQLAQDPVLGDVGDLLLGSVQAHACELLRDDAGRAGPGTGGA